VWLGDDLADVLDARRAPPGVKRRKTRAALARTGGRGLRRDRLHRMGARARAETGRIGARRPGRAGELTPPSGASPNSRPPAARTRRSPAPSSSPSTPSRATCRTPTRSWESAPVPSSGSPGITGAQASP